MANVITEPSVLAKVIGKGKPNIAYCSSCGISQLNVQWCSHLHYSWAINLSCVLCSNKWTICTLCSSLRVQLIGYAVARHHRSKHAAVEKHTAGCGISSIQPASPQLFEVEEDMLDFNSVSYVGENYGYIDFGNGLSNFFFHYEKMGKTAGGGATALVKRALMSSDVAMGNVHPTHVSFHMSIAQFVQDLTRNERSKFANIMSQSMTVLVGDNTNVDTNCSLEYIPSQLPNTFHFIDRTYVRGKYAILPNLPHPTVRKVNNHSYVSLVDIVAHVLGFSSNIRCVSRGDVELLSRGGGDVTSIIESNAVLGVVRRGIDACGLESVVILSCIEWSDDFDPSASAKSNRNSCWVKTVTIIPSYDVGTVNRERWTYPIALGKKQSDHNDVEELFAEELQKLRSGNCCFYNNSTQTYVKVYLELIVSLQDQPERRGGNYIMLGSGKYSARWGHSCNIGMIAKHLPSCDSCMQFNKKCLQPPATCSLCTNWETVGSNVLHRIIAPNNYPGDELCSNDRYLWPFELCYDTLNACVAAAHNKYVNGQWTMDNVRQYCQSHCINKEGIEFILRNAQNTKMLKSLEGSNTVHHQYQVLLDHQRNNPDMYDTWKGPALWRRGVPLSIHVDVPMHLPFLGITKTVAKRVMEWTKLNGLNNSFLRISSDALQSLAKCNVDWCMALKINGPNFGGWVSENFLALARFNRWLLSLLPLLKKDEIYVEPNRPYTTWNLSELKGWLKNKGMSDKGRKAELLVRVAQEKEVTSNPEITMTMNEGSGHVTTVLNVCKALSVMIGHLLQKTVNENHIERTSYAIKLFLSAYHTLDQELQVRAKQSGNSSCAPDAHMSYGWLTSYNFICLMNLPSTMRTYGAITNVWEGGEMGEKYSQRLKPRLKGGLKGNWHVNALTLVLKQDSMSRIQLPNDGHLWVKPMQRERRNRCYKNAIEVVTIYNRREPLSVVFFSDGRCGAMLRQENEYVEITFDPGTARVHELHYWSIAIADTMRIKPDETGITNYCILLPKLCKNGLPQPTELDVRYYYVKMIKLIKCYHYT